MNNLDISYKTDFSPMRNSEPISNLGLMSLNFLRTFSMIDLAASKSDVKELLLSYAN